MSWMPDRVRHDDKNKDPKVAFEVIFELTNILNNFF
jgi:hypothetical protein